MKYTTKYSLNYTLFDQAIVSGSNFISTILIARLLGLVDFGIFSTMWLILLFINSIHMSLIILPFMTLSVKENFSKKYFGSILFWQYVFVLLSFLVTFAILSIYPVLNLSFYTILSFSFLVLLYHTHDYYRRYFFVIKDFFNVLIIDFISYFLRLSILIFLLFNQNNSSKIDINTILEIFIIMYLIGIVIAISKYKFTIGKNHIYKTFHEHWIISKWLLPAGVMQWTSINLFIVISSFVLGPVAVGAIKIGQNIAMVFNLFFQGMENFVPSDGMKIFKQKGMFELKKYLIKIIKYILLLIFLFIAFMFIYSPDIVNILYGNKYIEYSFIINWYSIILIFMFLILIVRVFLRIIEDTKIWFHSYLVTSIYSLTTVFPLIYIFNIHGVMFGILSAHIVLLTTVYILYRRKYATYNK